MVNVLKPKEGKPAPQGTKRRGKRDESQPLNKDVYNTLKKNILSFKIRPRAVLNERAIAAEMGVSRTPVREAFQCLEADGLVKRYPKLGVLVTELDLRDVVEAFQVREFLESPAAAIAAKVLKKSEISELIQTFNSLEQREPTDEAITVHDRADKRTHDLVAQATGNSLLVSILANLNNICQRASALGTLVRFKESITEHRRLLQAMLNRDSEGAERAMSAHLAAARKRLAEVIVNPQDFLRWKSSTSDFHRRSRIY